VTAQSSQPSSVFVWQGRVSGSRVAIATRRTSGGLDTRRQRPLHRPSECSAQARVEDFPPRAPARRPLRPKPRRTGALQRRPLAARGHNRTCRPATKVWVRATVLRRESLPTSFLHRSSPAEHHGDGLEENLEVGPVTPTLHVKEVEANHLLEWQDAAPPRLPQAGDSGSDGRPLN
jgi:hypothetical protein